MAVTHDMAVFEIEALSIRNLCRKPLPRFVGGDKIKADHTNCMVFTRTRLHARPGPRASTASTRGSHHQPFRSSRTEAGGYEAKGEAASVTRLSTDTSPSARGAVQ